MTAENDADREAFEAAAEAVGFDMTKVLGGEYASVVTDDARRLWDRALAHARQPGEPVAWRYRYLPGDGKPMTSKWTIQKNRPAWWAPDQTDVVMEPLYTHPAPPVPVASEVLDTLIHAVEIIRDVEKDTDYAVDSWTTPEADRFTSKAQAVINRAKAHPAPPAPVEVPEELLTAFAVLKNLLALLREEAPGTPLNNQRFVQFGIRANSAVADAERALHTIAAPSPASPEKGTERMREALEKFPANDFATETEYLREIDKWWIKVALPALGGHFASLPADPEGEERDTRPVNCRFRLEEGGKPHPKSGCDVAGCRGVFGALCRSHPSATHPTAPKPAEVRVKGLEWRPHHSRPGIIVADLFPGEYWAWELAGYGYWSWGSLTGREVPGGIEAAKAAVQADHERRSLSRLEPISPAPAAEEFRRGAEGPAHKLASAVLNYYDSSAQPRSGQLFDEMVKLAIAISNSPLTSGEG